MEWLHCRQALGEPTGTGSIVVVTGGVDVLLDELARVTTSRPVEVVDAEVVDDEDEEKK